MMKLRQLRLIARHPVYSFRCFRNKKPFTTENIEFYRAASNLRSSNSKLVRESLLVISDLCEKVDVSISIPLLVDCLKNENFRLDAIKTLGNVAEKEFDISTALNDLIGCLVDTDENVRKETAYVFSRAARKGLDITKAVPALIKCLEDKNRAAINYAAKALGYGAKNEAARDGLIQKLLDASYTKLQQDSEDSRNFRVDVLLALEHAAENGVNIALALPELDASLEDAERNDIRIAAAKVVKKVTAKESGIQVLTSSLIKCFRDGDLLLKEQASLAVQNILKIGEDRNYVIGELTVALHSKNETTRSYAINILIQDMKDRCVNAAKRGLVNHQNASELLETLKYSDERNSRLILETLFEAVDYGLDLQRLIPKSIELLENENARTYAIILLLALELSHDHAKQIMKLTKNSTDLKLPTDLAQLTAKCVEILNGPVAVAA